ncbi:substrate-binding domain-containing protein [Polaribacter sp. R77954]|uniref:substrate-binding domain-containing protein n=1 Tax=Polaribacter sp. R77954 TaxID=3093870 RepID=UPI0037C7EAFD
MITIKGIAKEANVSEGTVDRVLHNRGGVSKKTEAKVRKVLELHNFSVNPIASALALKNKYRISVLIPDFNDADLFWKSPYLGIQKAEEEVKNFGIEVNRFTFNQYDPLSYYTTFKYLLETKPSAVIIVPNFTQETNTIVNELETLNIPYLFLNIDLKDFKNITYVGQDAYTAGYIAAKLMSTKDFNRSDCLIIQARYNITKNNTVFNRINGFDDYFKENNIHSKTQTLKIENLNNSVVTKEKINSYLKSHPEIKGIFVPSSRIHVVVDCLDKDYFKKLTLIGFDNTPQNINCLLNDTVAYLISQKPFEQGYESIKIFADFLLQKKAPISKMYLPIDILMKENVKYNNGNQSIYENEQNLIS